MLGDKTKFSAHEPLHIDLVYAEHAEREKRNQAAEYLAASVAAPVAAPPVAVPPVAAPPVAVPPVAAPPAVEETGGGETGVVLELVRHTTIFEPSQLDPELRGVLDGLYRKARAETDDDEET